MKVLIKRCTQTLFFISTALFLSACDGDWGIDQDVNAVNPIDNNISIPMCSSDIRDNSAALKVEKNTVVTPLEAGTKVRIWHYVNTEKYACTISGSAVIVQ